MPLTRAVIRSYDPLTQRAEIEHLEGPRALQPAVPFAATFDTRYRKAGRQVLIENYPDQGPVILVPWRALRQGNVQDYLYDANAMSFTAQAWTPYAGLGWADSIVLVEPSYLWLSALLNLTCSAARDMAGWFRWHAQAQQPGWAAQVDAIAAFGCANAAMQQTVTLACRTPLLAPGAYSAEVQGWCFTAGDTIAARYSSAGYIAIPGE